MVSHRERVWWNRNRENMVIRDGAELLLSFLTVAIICHCVSLRQLCYNVVRSQVIATVCVFMVFDSAQVSSLPLRCGGMPVQRCRR